ncbi:MAG: prephenate dehydratase [Promethearchaeota archaeon]
MTQDENGIEKLRKEIDEIDDQIVDLLNKRGNAVIKIGSIKKTLNISISQPHREKEVIDRIKKKGTVFKKTSIEAIWKELISASKAIQDTISKIGYLGPMGTFTHQAALDYFPKAGSEFIPIKNLIEIFDSIEKGKIDYGVVPIENTLQGTVRETLDLLIDRNLVIYGEIELRIIQNLISLKGVDMNNIQNIFSHPQAFSQTRSWIKANLPSANLIDVSSTAEAIRRVRKLNDPTYAAIGTEFASNIYGLDVAKHMIEDETTNFTRFLVISKNENPIKEGKIKTSIVFVTKHEPGALYWVLKIFSEANINLCKIESRPFKKVRWEYIFFVDFEGNKDNENVKEALRLIETNVLWQKILGSYPTN